MRRIIGAAVFLAAAAGLAGCSHSCIPPGWYQAKVTRPLQRPPGAPMLAHDTSYDIPGGNPSGGATRDQACLVQPPNTLKKSAPPATTAPSATTAHAGGAFH